MHITFYGAIREVTGSMHLVGTNSDRVLLDCGMFQGRRKETEEKNRNLPFDPGILSSIVLSHAHIDHSGRIPMLTRQNFSGRIISTRATAHACEYLLPDSAHIQESDANYLNYKTVRDALKKISPKSNKKARDQEIRQRLKRSGHDLNIEAINELIDEHQLASVRPLYTIEDAEAALSFFDGYPYREPVAVGKDVTCTLYDAGHILGSAITVLHSRENGKDLTIGFTGDLGRFNKPILKDPVLEFAEEHRKLDLLIIESTYGDRMHEPVVDMAPKLKHILNETFDRGGTVLIPSFAFGRTQELLYVIHDLYDRGEVPKRPVYVDSPLATKLTRVFGEHPEVYDKETHETFLQRGDNPFAFDQVHFTASVQESIDLMKEKQSHIVISASGMCEAGRILHHLRYKVHNERNTILIVGYMAQNTLGRRILEEGSAYALAGRKGEPPLIKFYNKHYPLKARVENLGGFSAHADYTEMLRFLKESNLQVGRIAIVHGEEDQSLALAKRVQEAGYPVVVPKVGESVEVGK